jgi:Tfp pilus assembly protein FimT
MSTVEETQTSRERSTLYIVLAVVFGLLMVVGLFAFRSARSTAEAEEKAAQLITELENAGARAPSQEAVVRVLGDDGGAICADPNGALSRATLLAQLANGSGGPGSRPVIADSRVVQGELMVIKIYCPQELEEFQEFVNSLKLSDTTGG